MKLSFLSFLLWSDFLFYVISVKCLSDEGGREYFVLGLGDLKLEESIRFGASCKLWKKIKSLQDK